MSALESLYFDLGYWNGVQDSALFFVVNSVVFIVLQLIARSKIKSLEKRIKDNANL